MSAPTTNARVRVSWDGSGAFTGAYDDVTARTAGDPGLTIDLGKDGARSMDPPKVTALDFELWNDDGRYSQERPDSPIYQLVLPGRPVSLSVALGTADYYDGSDEYTADDFYDGIATYALASAAVQDIEQTTDYGNRRVSLACLGVESTLVEGTVTVGVMTAPRIDQCITALLDAVGWPSGARRIASADCTLLYWWCDERAPWDALTELVRSEGAGSTLYVEAGTVVFENRNYRASHARSTASQATFFDTGFTTDPLTLAYTVDDAYTTSDLYDGATTGLSFTSLTCSPGFTNIRNRATYTTRQRTLGALGVVWTYGAAIVLSAAQSVTLIARPNDPFQSAVTPALTTDYTVSGGTVSVSLSASSGLVAFITVTATSGAPTVSGAGGSGGLQLRAQSLTVAGQTAVQNSVDASSSILKFSPVPGVPIARVYDVGGWPEIGVAHATAVCDSWVNRYQIQRPAVEITIQNADDAHVRQILERTVSDRITVSERNTGLSGDLWINSKQMVISGAGGRRLVCVLRCEQCEYLAGSIWDLHLWDSAVWGV